MLAILHKVRGDDYALGRRRDLVGEWPVITILDETGNEIGLEDYFSRAKGIELIHFEDSDTTEVTSRIIFKKTARNITWPRLKLIEESVKVDPALESQKLYAEVWGNVIPMPSRTYQIQ